MKKDSMSFYNPNDPTSMAAIGILQMLSRAARRPLPPLTEAQKAYHARRAEIGAHNAAVDTKKAEKRAAKAARKAAR